MNQYKQVAEYYQTVADTQEAKANDFRKRIFNVGTLRLLVFLGTIALVYLFWGQNSLVWMSAIFGLFIFLSLLVFHNSLFRKKDYYDSQVRLAKDELKGLNYDYAAFDGGKEYIHPEHSFSYDLDLFGEKSIFQSLNRTISKHGKNKLAAIFQSPLEDKSQITERQNAVKELAQKHKLMFHFRTLGSMGSEKELEKPIAKTLPTFKGIGFWKVMIWVVPIGYLILFILWQLNLISGTVFVPLWFITLFISLIPSKAVKAITDYFQQGNLIPSAYSELIEVIENESFDSPLLQKIKNSVTQPAKASISLKKLKKYKDNLDLSYTFPILLIFNPYLLWNVRYAIAIYQWLQENKKNLEIWQQAVADFDALVSLATYSFNHPDYVFPTPEEQFVFEGKALAHPLIKADVVVRNDVNISHESYFLVVTGANMAGKSTFLRTVGVNHVLACIGTVVCAESLRFHPEHLVTNLRTTDSLNDNESYFFAELKRLKMIINRLQSGEKLFIILDEILKGTNSEDKRKGSMALMRQLISLQSNGIIATHDLELGKLQEEFPDHVKNYCFEAEIKNEHLTFSYKIREGIAQNMNASFLMKQMGITGL